MEARSGETPVPSNANGPLTALQFALDYSRRGWSVIPVKSGTKMPAVSWREFQSRRATEQEIREKFDPDCGGRFENLAIVLGPVSGRLCVRDFDVGEAYDEWADRYPEYARVLPTVKTARGCHIYFRLPADCKINGTLKFYDGELRVDGCIVLAPPSLHPSGVPYEWIIPLPRGEIPEIDPSEIGLVKSVPDRPNVVQSSDSAAIREGRRNDALASLAGSMRRRGASEDAIRAALREQNAACCQPPLEEYEVDRIAQSIARYTQGNLKPNHITELGNARRLVGQHGMDLRYVALARKWYVWDGRHWCPDDTGETYRRAKRTVASIYEEAGQLEDERERKKFAGWGLKSEAEKSIKAMVGLAQSEPEIAVLPDAFDTDPWLLNCSNGTLDLRSGCLGPNRREDLITKLVPIPFDAAAACPPWHSFLDRVTDGDRDLQGFLRRAVGYSLTGDTREQVLFILYGTGQNGKSRFLDVLRLLLGDYALSTPTKTLTVKPPTDATNDLARLRGARLVTAVESEDGQRFAESLVKQVTGGDSVVARFLHREFFEFIPTFKLFLATNHKPTIRGGELAIWRRIRLIPFVVTIPERERDKTIVDKLRVELPGILRWAVEGCLEWQQYGLGESPSVVEATASYRDEMDVFGRFLKECCIEHSEAKAAAAALYRAFEKWRIENGEATMTQTALGLRLAERGFFKRKLHGTNFWLGLGLLDGAESRENG